MAEEKVVVSGGEGKACDPQESGSPSRQELDQNDLGLILESVGRLKLMGRMFWEMDEFDKEELGTVAIMLDREADHIFETMSGLQSRLDLAEVRNG